jgi:hypothetical protein
VRGAVPGLFRVPVGVCPWGVPGAALAPKEKGLLKEGPHLGRALAVLPRSRDSRVASPAGVFGRHCGA